MLGDDSQSQNYKVTSLSTHLAEKLEKIQKILEALVEESARRIPIVVEGKKDVDALRQFGVAGPVLCFKTRGKTLSDAMQEIEQTETKEVILLLDFDRRGKEGTNLLKENLERAHIAPNLAFWQSLSSLLARDVQCVESISAYVKTLKRKANVGL